MLKDKASVQEYCVVTGMDSARWCMETLMCVTRRLTYGSQNLCEDLVGSNLCAVCTELWLQLPASCGADWE